MEDIRKRLERSRGKTLWIVGGRISFDARTAVRANIAIRNGLILGIADRSGPGANYSSAETEALDLSEGTDEKSAEEIFVLRGLGALDRRTVIVHGVGLGAAGHELVEGSGAAIIWCPTSNIFTLGQTLDAQTIMACRRMALGSDSALTAQGDLLDEIAFANHRHGITPERIYSLVTDGAADVLRLRSGEGMLRPGARADLIAFKDTGGSPADALVHAGISRVELVILGGQPTLFSPEMTKRWPDEFRASMESTRVGGVERFVRAPVRWLMEETRKHLGDRFCLAGKEICS